MHAFNAFVPIAEATRVSLFFPQMNGVTPRRSSARRETNSIPSRMAVHRRCKFVTHLLHFRRDDSSRPDKSGALTDFVSRNVRELAVEFTKWRVQDETDAPDYESCDETVLLPLHDAEPTTAVAIGSKIGWVRR